MISRLLACLVVLLSLIPADGGGAKSKDSPAVAEERKKLVGIWAMYPSGKDELRFHYELHEDGFCSVLNANRQLLWRNKFAFDPTTKPKQLDIPDSGGALELGIYEHNGDTIKWCVGSFGKRPEEFGEKDGAHLYTLKRIPKKSEDKK